MMLVQVAAPSILLLALCSPPVMIDRQTATISFDVAVQLTHREFRVVRVFASTRMLEDVKNEVARHNLVYVTLRLSVSRRAFPRTWKYLHWTSSNPVASFTSFAVDRGPIDAILSRLVECAVGPLILVDPRGCNSILGRLWRITENFRSTTGPAERQRCTAAIQDRVHIQVYRRPPISLMTGTRPTVDRQS